MSSIAVKTGLTITRIIASILVVAGMAMVQVAAAGERSLEITNLRLSPDTIPVNQAFDFTVSFKADIPDSSGAGIATHVNFNILKQGKTLFSSKRIPIQARNGEIKSWTMHMNPVPAKGTYTILVFVSYEELTARKSLELAIGVPPAVVERTNQQQPETAVSAMRTPPGAHSENVIHVRHILLKTRSDADRLISEMNGLRGDQLRDNFIMRAKSTSVGPTGASGGDLGFIKRQGRMVREFENAAFDLYPGTITATPVKTVYGYHVIYREAATQGETRDLDRKYK